MYGYLKRQPCLPTPPGPVSVSSGVSGRVSSAITSSMSESRPISGVRGAGMLCGCPEVTEVSMASAVTFEDLPCREVGRPHQHVQ